MTNPIRSDISSLALRKAAEDVQDPAKRRFLAIADVLDGMGRYHTARTFDVMPHTLRKWIHWFNEGGLDRLRHDQPTKRKPSDIGLEIDTSAEELRRAAGGFDPRFARRLLVIADILDGMDREAAAANNNCKSDNINTWVKRLNIIGIEAMLLDRRGRIRDEPIRSDISADDLRKAAEDADVKRRTRFLAVADVVSGMSQEDAARKFRRDPATICRWMQRFNKKGLDGLRGR